MRRLVPATGRPQLRARSGSPRGDAAVVVDAQHRQGPAALEPAVELDQDRADAVVGLGDLLGGDGGAAVEEAAQRWGDGPARAVQGVGEAGHHAGDEEAGGGLVAVHGLHEGVGVEALQQDLGQAHVQEREGPDEAGAVGELLGGDEDLVAVEPGPVGAGPVQGDVVPDPCLPVAVGDGHGEQAGGGGHAGVEDGGAVGWDPDLLEGAWVRAGPGVARGWWVSWRWAPGRAWWAASVRTASTAAASKTAPGFGGGGAGVDGDLGGADPLHGQVGLDGGDRVPVPQADPPAAQAEGGEAAGQGLGPVPERAAGADLAGGVGEQDPVGGQAKRGPGAGPGQDGRPGPGWLSGGHVRDPVGRMVVTCGIRVGRGGLGVGPWRRRGRWGGR